MVRFSALDNAVFEDTTSPKATIANIPDMAHIVESASKIREMYEEADMLSKYTKAFGFSKDGHFQHRLRIDSSLILILEQIHEAQCSCGRKLWGNGGHKEWAWAWAETEAGKPYDVRGKVAI